MTYSLLSLFSISISVLISCEHNMVFEENLAQMIEPIVACQIEFPSKSRSSFSQIRLQFCFLGFSWPSDAHLPRSSPISFAAFSNSNVIFSLRVIFSVFEIMLSLFESPETDIPIVLCFFCFCFCFHFNRWNYLQFRKLILILILFYFWMRQVYKKEMDKDPLKSSNNNGNTSNSTIRERTGGGGDASLLRATTSETTRQTTSSEFVLQWGNRKRLRCMKVQVKDDSTGPAHRTTVRVVRTDKDPSNQPTTATTNNNYGVNHHANGYFNLRQRPSSSPPPPPPLPPQRVLRYQMLVYSFNFFLFSNALNQRVTSTAGWWVMSFNMKRLIVVFVGVCVLSLWEWVGVCEVLCV